MLKHLFMLQALTMTALALSHEHKHGVYTLCCTIKQTSVLKNIAAYLLVIS